MATYKVVVPISGGKDSQSCLKLALQKFKNSEILGLFCDTKFEHPLTYQHVDNLRNWYQVEIDTVCMGSVLQQSEKWGRFPGGGSRHCTDYLKIRPTKDYITSLAKKQGPFEVWYGMRSDESYEREKRYEFKLSDDLYEPHEIMPSKYPKYLGKMGVKFRLPVLDWSTKEVFTFLEGKHNPLYDEGFDRVGCFPCLAGGDQWKEKAFKHDDFGKKQYEQTMIVSEKIGKSLWTSQRGKWNNEQGQGCLICSI
jgi:3'-phosphoadenosine 5'-phosphosulfate sulfotransferase (PAPS reductase)/FAD synthetase